MGKICQVYKAKYNGKIYALKKIEKNNMPKNMIEIELEIMYKL